MDLDNFFKKINENTEKIILFFKFLLISALFFGLGIIYGTNIQMLEKSLKITQNEQIMASL